MCFVGARLDGFPGPQGVYSTNTLILPNSLLIRLDIFLPNYHRIMQFWTTGFSTLRTEETFSTAQHRVHLEQVYTRSKVKVVCKEHVIIDLSTFINCWFLREGLNKVKY